MNSIYIGDRELDPPDDEDQTEEECKFCEGSGWIDVDHDCYGDCSDCNGTGRVRLTDIERRQKAFDDFDPPDNNFGEIL